MQRLCLRLMLAGVSLRGVARTLAVLADVFGWTMPIPHWTTARLWLLRLGHAMLTAPKEHADDWAWLIDHSVQVGQGKCLVILGLRLRDLPEPGQCLRHADMKVLAIVPRPSWSGEQVDQDLEAATTMTGVPRVIVSDHGGELNKGMALFQQRHPQTVALYDAKHKAACLLKARLAHSPRWQEFQRRLEETRRAIQQTELAYLVPPGAKRKARFMNLETDLRWAIRLLAILRKSSPAVQADSRPQRLAEKLGWLEGFAADVAEWSEWQQIVNVMVKFVNTQGLKADAADTLRAAWPQTALHGSSAALAQELVAFVAEQASRIGPQERFPGSTEILESCFGRFKQLEKQQARGGFTSLLLGFGALVADTTTQAISAAMAHSKTKKIFMWCREHLGITWFSQRKMAFQTSATTTG